MRLIGKYLQVGQRLKKLRGDLSQEKFAKEIGVSYKAYQRYEYGISIPKAKILNKIAEKEWVTVNWILTGRIRSLEKEVLARKKGIPVLEHRLDVFDMHMVDRLRKKGFFISPDIDSLIESETFEAASVLFAELPNIYEFLNIIVDLKQQRRFQEFSEVIEKIGRIFLEGDKVKLEAIRSFLKALDPGKKEQNSGIQPGQKKEDNDGPDQT